MAAIVNIQYLFRDCMGCISSNEPDDGPGVV
jgi:hypothetical protein